jgi:cell filamentation protein
MDDPYVYPGTEVLINREGIRDPDELVVFERLMTANRMETLPAVVPLTTDGYRQLHRHIFQDVYEWAGQDRSVNISKGQMFCLAPYIDAHMERRFALIQSENGLRNLSAPQFSARAAHHLCEINAIHPFREGNGRTQRAFLELLAKQGGHRLDVSLIQADAWMEASRESFGTGDFRLMQRLIDDAIQVPPSERERAKMRWPVSPPQIVDKAASPARACEPSLSLHLEVDLPNMGVEV